jgi:hypothetical protein
MGFYFLVSGGTLVFGEVIGLTSMDAEFRRWGRGIAKTNESQTADKDRKNIPQGLKPRHLRRFSGTDKSVPYQNIASTHFFRQAVKWCPFKTGVLSAGERIREIA